MNANSPAEVIPDHGAVYLTVTPRRHATATATSTPATATSTSTSTPASASHCYANPDTNTAATATSATIAYCYANPHSNSDTNIHANPDTDTHPYLYANSHPNSDSCPDAHTRSHAYIGPHTNTHRAIPTAAPLSTPGGESTPQTDLQELEQPAPPVIGDAIPRIHNTLGGIASSPRRRTTLIVIQAVTSAFALGVFSYLIARKR